MLPFFELYFSYKNKLKDNDNTDVVCRILSEFVKENKYDKDLCIMMVTFLSNDSVGDSYSMKYHWPCRRNDPSWKYVFGYYLDHMKEDHIKECEKLLACAKILSPDTRPEKEEK